MKKAAVSDSGVITVVQRTAERLMEVGASPLHKAD